ncbi:MAG: hypothetical protein DDT19_02325 [Syntrophomonadaceae bacterium]|nr:hypothetical protein [Bacillota bacterium]
MKNKHITTRGITTKDIAKGRMYWGAGALPQGAELVGTVTRRGGRETGALIKMPTGILVQGNAGCLRSLPPQMQKMET